MRSARRPWLAAIPVVAGMLVAAAPAGASTVGLQGTALVYTAAPGERNSLSISIQTAGIYVTDAGVTMTPGAGCAFDTSTEIACPRVGVASVAVTLGDGEDAETARAGTGLDLPITVDGGPGNDQLQGGAGADQLIGGPGEDGLNGGDGNDTINAADGGYGDQVDCGAGADTASIDPVIGDIPSEEAIGCETVTRPPLKVGAYLGSLGYKALPGAANDVTFTPRPATKDVLITDRSGLVSLTACDQTTAGDLTSLLCSGDGPDGWDLGDGDDRFRGGPAHVTAGTGNDTVALVGSDSEVEGGAGSDRLSGDAGDQTFHGGPGNDTITGGGGYDVIFADAGNDTLSTRDGTRDDALCGSGKDRATVDWLDDVSACEKYVRGDTSPPAAAAATTRAVRFPTTQFTTRDGTFPKFGVPVSCPAAAGAAGCTVTLSVYLGSERRADVPFRADPVGIPAGAKRTVVLKGESHGLEIVFHSRPKPHRSALLAIVTSNAALHTRTSLRKVTIIGS